MTDYLIYYDSERYLFEIVTKRFHDEGSLNAIDFFTIVSWKANRAISRIAIRLLHHDATLLDLESASRALTQKIHDAPNHKERLRIMLEEWGFRLPIATAILTVCYPGDFSVYDYRVCDILDRFQTLADKSRFEDIWSGYLLYLDAVRASDTPANLSLREKDRWLWGKSVYQDMLEGITTGFRKPEQHAKATAQANKFV